MATSELSFFLSLAISFFCITVLDGSNSVFCLLYILPPAGLSSIGVHNLSPGMVLTDLLLKDSTPIARRFFNTLAEEPETVAADLAPRILSIQGTGQSIECLSPPSAFVKVALGFPQIIAGGRFFDKEGNRVQVNGNRYQENGVKIL